MIIGYPIFRYGKGIYTPFFGGGEGGNPDKKMAVGAAEEQFYAQVGTLDPQNHQHPQLQPNQIFYNAQFNIDTMGKVSRKLKICTYYVSIIVSGNWVLKIRVCSRIPD